MDDLGRGKGGEGRALFTRVCVDLRNLHEHTGETSVGLFGRAVSGPSLFLCLARGGRRRRLFIDIARRADGESQAFISRVTRAGDWRSIKGRFTRPDSDANRRKINTAYYSVRINRSTRAMSTNAISFCSKRVDIRGMRWPRSRRPGIDRPRSRSNDRSLSCYRTRGMLRT